MKFAVGDAVLLAESKKVELRRVVGIFSESVVTEPVAGVPESGDRVRSAEADLAFADPALQFFRWSHLPLYLREVSEPFGRLAHDTVISLPNNPQRALALQHLLEAKDAAVRARIYE